MKKGNGRFTIIVNIENERGDDIGIGYLFAKLLNPAGFCTIVGKQGDKPNYEVTGAEDMSYDPYRFSHLDEVYFIARQLHFEWNMFCARRKEAIMTDNEIAIAYNEARNALVNRVKNIFTNRGEWLEWLEPVDVFIAPVARKRRRRAVRKCG